MFASRHLLLPAMGALLLVALLTGAASGATGRLPYPYLPELSVSPYDDPPIAWSVALYAPTANLFGYPFQREPYFIRSSFDKQAITFNSSYYRIRRQRQEMVPVTVDAPGYLAYRKEKSVETEFSSLMTRSITRPDERRGRGGLGISLGLPKRLNKIFGEGGAGLRVSGFREIRFSGRSQWTDGAESDLYRQSKFPSLNMEQRYRFDINGTIGSKITVKVSEDSQQDIPLANRLIIRYRGDEDDILKSIEAGNTNLSLPRTRFVGYSQNIRGLFGLKAEAQVGRLTFTGIASQEQGSSERVSISPTGEESAEYIRDYNYQERRIFDLGHPEDFQAGDSIVKLFIYREVDKTREPEALPGILYVDPNNPDRFPDERVLSVTSQSQLLELEQTAYVYFSDPTTGEQYVVFSSPQRVGKALGVYMQIQRGANTVEIGNIDGDTLRLKLLYHSNPREAFNTWDLMWRNCYSIPRNVEFEDIEIKIFKGSAGNEGTANSLDYQEVGGQSQRYIEILGLDQYTDATAQKIPDGRLDNRREIFRPDWGLLILPDRRPFDTDTQFVADNGSVTFQLAERVPKIYDYGSPSDKTDASRYYLQLVTTARSQTIPLGKPNIIEGSERVSVNSRLLQRGVDYTINYDFGQVTITDDEFINNPNANVDIQYEYAPFLALQKKTLLGMRAEYVWSRNLEFGTTFLYKSDKAEDRKPRVGQETSRAVVYSVDGSWGTQANFLTKAVNALPLIKTEAPSNFRVEGEVAQSRPNPNTEGVAYVDDFEAAQDELSLGLQRTIWKQATFPEQLVGSGVDTGRILWHAPREPFDVRDIWDIDPRQGEGSIRPLRLVFRPQSSQPAWAGVMRGFSGRIDAKRVQLLELRARVDTTASRIHGRLHIDIGVINEDLDGDDLPFTEDRIPITNGALEPEEDVGLDGLADVDEPGYDPDTLPDPSGDNWFLLGEGKCPLPSDSCGLYDENSSRWDNDSIYYEWLNGTEGNRGDLAWLGIPDEEQLNRSNFYTSDAYFSFVIDLDNLDIFRDTTTGKNGWFTYRIPIRDSSALDTAVVTGSETAAWDNVHQVRVWFESKVGQTINDTVEIAAWHFVQSNWRDSIAPWPNPDPPDFVVTSISEEDNSFNPPPGVEPYEDPNFNTTEAQQGLLLQFKDLVDDTLIARKDLFEADQYTGYRTLEMYVNGDKISAADVGKLLFVFRLGTSADNYYEQRRLVDTGFWNPRNHINIDFNEITALKDAALRERSREGYADIDTISADGQYRIRGNPNLNDIKYFEAGIINLDTSQARSGEIWLDELRLTDVRKDVGTAARISFSGNLADLASYNFSYESKDAYFRGLSSATRGGSADNLGSGKNDTRMSFSSSFNIDRFLPRSLGANIKTSFSHATSVQTPLLRTNSDIVLADSVRRSERSTSKTSSFSISESFNRKGRNPLFNLLLNRQSTSFSYHRSEAHSVTTPNAYRESYSVNSNFNLGMTNVPTLPIFFWTSPVPGLKRIAGTRLHLYPSTWTLQGSYGRNLSISDDISFNRRTTFTRDFSGTMNISYKVFDNLTTTYRYTTNRDLSDPDRVSISFSDFRLGLETRYTQSFSSRYDPQLVSFLTTGFSYSADYQDTYSRSTESRSSTMGRRWSVTGTFDHMQLLGGKKGPSREIRRPRGRRRVGGTEESKEEQEEAETEGPGRPFYDPPLAVLRFLTGWIKPPSYNYSTEFRSSIPGMLERPSLRYRFGLDRTTDVPTITEGGSSPSSSEGESYSFGSGFQLLGGLSIDLKFSRSISRDLVKQGSRYKSVSTNWPGLTIQIRRFTTLPLIKGVVNKFIDVFSPRTGYSRTVKETYDIDGDFLTARSKSSDHNPLLSVNFNLWRSLSLGSSYALSKSRDERFSSATGEFQQESRSRRTTLSLTAKYSFSAPSGISVPILGKIRFKSNVQISLDVSKSANTSENRRGASGWVKTADKSDLNITPNVAYNFSSQIKGGLRANWRDSADNFQNRKTHTRMLELWAEIRF